MYIQKSIVRVKIVTIALKTLFINKILSRDPNEPF